MTSTPSNASNRPDPTRIILNEKIGFEELIGQVDAIEKLKAFGDLYQARNEAPEHILLLGPSGNGQAHDSKGLCEAIPRGPARS